MESIQAKVPVETYRRFREYMERHRIKSRSDALRKLLAKALADEAVIENVRFEHRETRKEMERLTAFVAGNLGAREAISPQEIRGIIDRIAAKTNSME